MLGHNKTMLGATCLADIARANGRHVKPCDEREERDFTAH